MLTAILRQSGGAVILSVPKTVLAMLGMGVGTYVELEVNKGCLVVSPRKTAHRNLAERLAMSPTTPKQWHRDVRWLDDSAAGRECL